MSTTTLNVIWVAASLVALAGAYYIGWRRGSSWSYAVGRGDGYWEGRKMAVAQAEIGIDDGLERTDAPRPGAPAAVMHNADLARGRFLGLHEWERPGL